MKFTFAAEDAEIMKNKKQLKFTLMKMWQKMA